MTRVSSDGPPVPGVRARFVDERRGEYSVWGYKNVDVIFWYGTPTADGVRYHHEIVPRRVRATGAKMSTVHVVQSGAGLPDGAARTELQRLKEAFAASLGCFVIVMETDGFHASTVRGIVTGILLLGRTRHSSRVTKTLAEAAAWLPVPHERATAVKVTEDELSAYFESASKEHQARASARR